MDDVRSDRLEHPTVVGEPGWYTVFLGGSFSRGGREVTDGRQLDPWESFKAGENIILRRNENWRCGEDGQLPYFRRIIIQTVPEPATRANLIERGDADLSIDLAASDTEALKMSTMVAESVEALTGVTQL